MKIVQINTWYGIWSTGKLVEAIHKEMQKKGHESYVLYGRGPKVNDSNVIKTSSFLEPKINSVLSRASGYLYGGCCFSTKRIINFLKANKPDIVHLHCTNSFIVNNFKLLSFLGIGNYKVVLTLHAEYPYTGNCAHSLDCNQWINGCQKCPNKKRSTRSILFDNTDKAWLKMYCAFKEIPIRNRKIIAVSNWLKERAQRSRMFRNDEIDVILNGIDTTVYNKLACSTLSVSKNDNRKKCLFVVPNFSLDDDIKGCRDFLSITRKMEKYENLVFFVVGANRSGFDFSNYKNIEYLGPVFDNEKLAEIYSNSDATILLSKRETYSLVTAESIACGTPVVGYKAGAPETIAYPGFGCFVKNGDQEALIDSLCKVLEGKPYFKEDILCFYSSKTMISRYLSIYDALTRNK